MKKYLLTIAFCSIVLGAMGQEESALVSKKGYAILPAAGDIAIGVDALPYLEFLGNSFNGNTNNSLSLSKTTLYGKYYLSTDEAVRAELYIDKTKSQNTNYVRDDSQYLNNPNAQVEDLQIIDRNNFGLGIGYQRYRGYNRLRGTYGAMASYFLSRQIASYQWGNEMTTDNQRPTSTSWYGAGSTPLSRYIQDDSDLSQTVTLGVIGGIEYYLMPKVCIGGEIGVYMGYTWNSQADRTYETIDAQGNYQEMDLATSPKDNYFSLRTQAYDASRVAGRLYLLFHF